LKKSHQTQKLPDMYIRTYTVHMYIRISLPVLLSVAVIIAHTVLLGLVVGQELLVGDCTVLVVVSVVAKVQG